MASRTIPENTTAYSTVDIAELDLTGDELRHKIAQEIANFVNQRELGANEITIGMYAEVNGVTCRVAERQLQHAVDIGTIERSQDKILHDGRWVWAYKIVDHIEDS